MMAGNKRDDVVPSRHHIGQPPNPGGVGILSHPAEAGLDRRMVEDDRGRTVRHLVEPLAKPGGPGLAEGAAVTARLERVENEDPDRELVDRILDEAVRSGRVGEYLQEGLAAVVIA